MDLTRKPNRISLQGRKKGSSAQNGWTIRLSLGAAEDRGFGWLSYSGTDQIKDLYAYTMRVIVLRTLPQSGRVCASHPIGGVCSQRVEVWSFMTPFAIKYILSNCATAEKLRVYGK
ncbi:hypothetical protein H105_07228 [Trichophyton soudanense CBS 452.61]|uniref:Uncharacterized protein n=1 Tax=Trichophyton soudanense CBS 452.61 TaxID=1215331 RepID=A0A022XIU6_TRISD|nr:hypothetical protein H105_07228 [Trichophyton soudanense CBS 452.61]